MKTQSQSSFTGVFTLKTQEEANELASSVKSLVENAVNIFQLVDSGRSAEFQQQIRTVVSLSQSFLELTLDEPENIKAKEVITGMEKAEKELDSLIRGYAASRLTIDERERLKLKEDRNKKIALNMTIFFEKTADLCDQMEENQNKRALMMIKQAVQHLQILRDPRYADFPAKCKHCDDSLTYVENALENRINVAEQGSPSMIKMEELRESAVKYHKEIIEASKSLNANPNDVQAQEREKAAVTNVVSTIKLIGDMFLLGGAAVKTNYIFSYGKMNEALDSLNEAVMSGSKAEATNQAKTLVQEVKKTAEHLDTQDCEDLKRCTAKVVEATKTALDAPTDTSKTELDKAMADIKEQLALLSKPTKPVRQNDALRERLLAASYSLTNTLSDLTVTLSPRNPPHSPRTLVSSPTHSPSALRRSNLGRPPLNS